MVGHTVGLRFLRRLWLGLKILTVAVLVSSTSEAYGQAGALLGGSDNQLPEDTLTGRDVWNRTTPRDAITGFLNEVAHGRYAAAARYLDLSQLADTVDSAEVARAFERALTAGSALPTARISDDPLGDTDDRLPEGRDQIGQITTEQGKMEVVLERVEGVGDVPVWLVSSQTISSMVASAPVEETLLIDRILPDVLQSGSWFGVPPGHWLAALLLILLSYVLARGLIYIVERLLPMFWPRMGIDPAAGVVKAFVTPLALYGAVWFFVALSRYLGLSIVLRQKLSILTTIVGVFAILLLLWKLAQFIGSFTQNRMVNRGNLTGVSVVVFLRKAAKAAIVIIGIIAFLSALGIDVTAGLAALGIGGIALALGAQRAVENFVGGIALITDRPVRVGDFCQVGDIVGTVESIGMRSTRIRTLGRTIVTIPNGQFSSEKIENYAPRDRFWFNPTLTLRYETTPDQLRYILVEIRSLFYAHKLVSPDPARIRFESLGSDKLNLGVFAYITVSNYDEFLEVQEDLLLRIMDIIKESGAQFAFPSQTIYFARDHGYSEDKVKETEEKVREWRSKNEMPIPRFPPEKIQELRNSVDFPPEGSVSRKPNEN